MRQSLPAVAISAALLASPALGQAQEATSPVPPVAEFTICIVDAGLPDNITYFGTATRNTRMTCEHLPRTAESPTLPMLYASGWRLVQVVGEGWIAEPDSLRTRSPIYYLERLR
ncbi:hypothetical protein SAMN06297129_1936 [Pseudooceanicola antarcticus]|uniref:Protease inhibitor Inh n=1 Tax=Pseudooceanicola antarcticus TaxID=1247613 RepID=A0A285IS17_9RHOB|nr:hypothetical protein [Pseudooceanicola antarcticus]PJE31899.1 hypothetical protein CVM39_02010 [Pseudooceanicola antarcticus]SNY50754.1 hypothetical protein SAMN06297129_1936 [Pseudooceanicola antarcticus]